MSKFPRLEMMRAQRQRREDELTAPYQAELRTASSMISQLRLKMTFPADVLRFMDPSYMERQVLRQYTERNLPNLSVNLSADIADKYVTTVDIRIPPLGVRQVVAH
jgi:hypothetical protein